MIRRVRVLRRPRTTAERRAACAAEADRDEGAPGLRRRKRPSAWEDQVIAALSDRWRGLPSYLGSETLGPRKALRRRGGDR